MGSGAPNEVSQGTWAEYLGQYLRTPGLAAKEVRLLEVKRKRAAVSSHVAGLHAELRNKEYPHAGEAALVAFIGTLSESLLPLEALAWLAWAEGLLPKTRAPDKHLRALRRLVKRWDDRRRAGNVV